MASVVDVAVPDFAQAAEYYESLMAVTPDAGAGNVTSLSGDHLRINLRKAAAKPAQITLQVTAGMLARILDSAMKWQCGIHVDSARQVTLTDRYEQRWTLCC